MPRRVVVSSSSSSRVAVKPASIGAVAGCVGCDRVFCGVVRDAVGLKKFFDRAIRSTHPVENVDFLDGMCGSDCSIEKIAIEKALFRLRKNTRSGLRSEIALFDPPIRLHRNWPNEHTGTLNHENSRIRGQATAGQLEAATLSVRVLYKSASTVPRCIPLVFPSTRSNSATLLPSKLTRQPKKINEMPNSLCNKKTQIIARRFVVLL